VSRLGHRTCTTATARTRFRLTLEKRPPAGGAPYANTRSRSPPGPASLASGVHAELAAVM